MSNKSIKNMRKSSSYINKKKTLMQLKNKRCYYCGQPLTEKNISVDHKIPLSRGGENTYENLCLCCTECNGEKDNMTETEYREYLAYKINTPKREKFRYPACFSVEISEIKIPWLFLQAGVKPNKINKVKSYYDSNKCFDKPITLKFDNQLTDGYSRYVVAKSLGLKEVYAQYQI